MTLARLTFGSLVVCLMAVTNLHAQTSSLGAKARRDRVQARPVIASREAPEIKRNKVYDAYAWTAAAPRKPKTFKPGDLITIIVRERRTFDAEADLETRKRLTLQSELNAFIKLTRGGLGSADFQRGKPTVDYKLTNRLKNEGDSQREDTLTMRLTGKIIDVKPNGVLVLEAKARVRHDREVAVMTLTGTCRKEDVSADNTVLSTQVADKDITVTNHGALRDATSRGWILRMLDFFNPI